MPRRQIRCWEDFDDKDAGDFVSKSVSVFTMYADELVRTPGLSFEDSEAAKLAERLAADIHAGQFRCANKHKFPSSRG